MPFGPTWMWPAVVVVGMLKMRRVIANSLATVSMATSAVPAAPLSRIGVSSPPPSVAVATTTWADAAAALTSSRRDHRRAHV